MIVKFLVGGVTGAFVVMFGFGLKTIINIVNDHDDRGKGWKDSFKDNINSIWDWIFLFIFCFLTIIVVFGLLVSIFWG